ncbi:MAG: dihydrofolate reductase [Burkholderiales bacterium]|nr:dihydrofolate reductase [Burkholderiales bacterium]MDE1928050.1 dihydrofolate reductase [Burkholderiales bacterium]MDE2158770.1 dihydrofolate reductase [Burkholderiales bacterium]MDE2503609.1 dihydrofolate reductase [Burkholderiales bacterium]
MVEIVVIAAVARNGAIGRGNELLFRDPADMARFRATTLGAPVVMGRRTWDSLPPRFRPLPGRRNIVVSANPDFSADGAEVAPGLDAAIALAADAPRLYVIGGARLYALALPRADRLLLTEVDADYEADAWFPAWQRSDFIETARLSQRNAQGLRFDFVEYRRR